MSSSSSSWKSYGGTNHLEIANDITVNDLTVDTLSLKNAYSGVFKVIGDIYTTGNVNISSNLDTTGNSNTAGNSTISGSLTVDSYALVKNKLYLGDNDTDAVSDSTNPFFYATQLFTGLNTTTPTAPLDISINTECGVFFHSSSTINKNVLTKNNTNYGIIASANDTASCISFYNASTILEPSNNTIDISGILAGDATVYLTNGNLVLSSTNNIILNTPTIFTEDLSSTAINNEFITIYDSATSSTAYNYNRYVDATYTAGKALTLVGYGSEQGDISSGTFLSITNTNGVGIGIVGGSDPEHIDEPFSTTGLFINKELKEHATTAAAVLVSTNYYIPIQTAVMGTSHSHNRVSLGINTTNPSRDLFLLDINGQTRITNTDFFHDADLSFQIIKAEHLRGNPNYIVAVGSPTIVSGSTKDSILVSTDGGENWKYVFDSITTTTIATNKSFNNICIHSENILLLSNPTGQLVISFTQGTKDEWYNIISTGITTTIPIIGLTEIPYNSTETVYLLILYDSADNQFVTAKFKKSDITSIDSKAYSLELTQNTETNVGNYTHALSTIITDAGINTTDGSVVVSGIACKSKEYFYITTSNGIYKVSFELSEENEPILGNAYVVLSTVLSHNATYAYNDVKMFSDETYPDFAIFAGDGVISYTRDGTTFYDSDITSIDEYDSGRYFDSVNIYSLTVATAVGKNGTQIYYTLDGAESWSLLSEDILNATGIYRGIVPVGENPLVNAFMTTENTMVVFGTYSDFTASSNGLSKVFKGYLPQIFSPSTNTVLDICGNTNMWGNLFINENANIAGNETVYGVLTCDSSAVINEMTVNGIATFNGTIQAYSDISCSTNTYTIGSANVKGNTNALTDLFVYGNAYALTDLVVTNNTHLNGVLYAYTDISCATNTHTIGNVVAYGNVDAETNINVADSIYIANSVYSSGTVYCLTNLDVSGNAICHTDIDICGTLTAHSDVSLSELYVSGNTRFMENVYIDPLLEKHPRPINKPPLGKKTHILNHNRRIHQRAHRKLGVYRQRHQHERNLLRGRRHLGELEHQPRRKRIHLGNNRHVRNIIHIRKRGFQKHRKHPLRRRNRFGAIHRLGQHRHDKHL
jgi:predicted acyltransferase (DUF342 family)